MNHNNKDSNSAQRWITNLANRGKTEDTFWPHGLCSVLRLTHSWMILFMSCLTGCKMLITLLFVDRTSIHQFKKKKGPWGSLFLSLLYGFLCLRQPLSSFPFSLFFTLHWLCIRLLPSHLSSCAPFCLFSPSSFPNLLSSLSSFPFLWMSVYFFATNQHLIRCFYLSLVSFITPLSLVVWSHLYARVPMTAQSQSSCEAAARERGSSECSGLAGYFLLAHIQSPHHSLWGGKPLPLSKTKRSKMAVENGCVVALLHKHGLVV